MPPKCVSFFAGNPASNIKKTTKKNDLHRLNDDRKSRPKLALARDSTPLQFGDHYWVIRHILRVGVLMPLKRLRSLIRFAFTVPGRRMNPACSAIHGVYDYTFASCLRRIFTPEFISSRFRVVNMVIGNGIIAPLFVLCVQGTLIQTRQRNRSSSVARNVSGYGVVH